MTTRQILNKMPENVMSTIEFLRNEYSFGRIDHEELLAKSLYYLNGLEHAGLITQSERRSLFVYTTIKKGEAR